MPRSSSLLGALATVLAATTAVAGAPPDTEPPTARAIAEAHAAFACDLYRQLAEDTDTDLFFSPESIALALSMTLAGAAGATESEMLEVLHYPGGGPAVHAAAGELQAALNRPVMAPGEPDTPAFRLDVASRLWGQEGFPFLGEFLATCRDDYGAELGQVDFVSAPEVARDAINGWVRERTGGKITDLVPPAAIKPTTRLMLTNAVYFLAQWAEPFDAAATTEDPFHVPDAGVVGVPTMHQTGTFPYAATDEVQLLQLPYNGNRQVCEIVLPRARAGLAGIEADLSAAWLADLRGDARRRPVAVALPRFRIDARFDLGQTLAALGMPSAFSRGRADFSDMTEADRLSIDRVLHQAVVDLDEAGTEAAAATAVGMALTSAGPGGEPVTFTADHPFLFLIRDVETGAILFLGRVTDPRE